MAATESSRCVCNVKDYTIKDHPLQKRMPLQEFKHRSKEEEARDIDRDNWMLKAMNKLRLSKKIKIQVNYW
jgi:hypothetical protein